MRRLRLLLIVILIKSCVAQNSCGTKPKCTKLGKKIGADVFCQPQVDDCDGKVYTGKKFCKNKTCGCCVPECGDPKPACEDIGGVCQSKNNKCVGNLLLGKQYCFNTKTCGCCAPIDCSKSTLRPCEALDGICMSQDEECDGREVIDETFCNSSDTCKCCFPETQSPSTCCPANCTYENLRGRCLQEPTHNYNQNVGSQECQDGCQCYIIDKKPCEPRECQHNGVKGQCSHNEITGSENVGEQECKDGCNCWISKECPNLYCEAEHQGQTYKGICRTEACHSMETRADTCLNSDCNCCINVTTTCEPRECKYDGLLGECSREEISGLQNVGEQECKDGCDCWVPAVSGCLKPHCTAFHNNQIYRGICRLEECLDMETQADKCPHSDCNCCINTTTQCNPRECRHNNVSGLCSRDEIQGWSDIGEQECKDGCKCWVPQECPKHDCEVVYKDELYKGICRVEECLETETRADKCPHSNCNCCIIVTERCEPDECKFEGVSGRCSRDDITGWYNVGEQECKDGCNCWVPKVSGECPNKYCKAVFEDVGYKGICRLDGCLNMETASSFCHNSTCTCCVNVTHRCNDKQCISIAISASGVWTKVPGICSDAPLPGHDNVGQENCEDGCNCWVEQKPCNPRECNYEGASGRCSSVDLPGLTNVGEQDCKDGCICYVPTDPSNCDNERKCDRPDAAAEGYNTIGQCRKNCHDFETPYDTCDIDNQDDCSCCLRKKVSECPKPDCLAVYQNQDYKGICRSDGCLSMEESNELCPDSNCKCCFNVSSNCDNERKCERPNAEVQGFYPTGHCRRSCHDDEMDYDSCDIDNQDGCLCCLRRKVSECPKPDCHTVYQNQDYKGICKQEGCLSTEIGPEMCPDSHCKCCINVTSTLCNPRECQISNGEFGICSRDDIAGYIDMGEDLCKDGCKCWMRPDAVPCNPRECQFKGVSGRCSRDEIHGSQNVGEQECKDGCKCWLPQDCGPACESVAPTMCMCMINGNQCPDGYCYYDSDLCNHEGCTCCKETYKPECVSKKDQCSAPGDYCVDKWSSKCPKGFTKVANACTKKSSSFPSELEIEKMVISIPQNISLKNDCDCCKSLGCIPNGNACSGKGQYCIDSDKSCPSLTHTTTYDCSKPVVENGVIIQYKLCKCCKPMKIVVGEVSSELEKPVLIDG